MKRILLGLLVLGAVGITSCQKCKTCTKAGYDDQTECRSSYDPVSKLAWEEDINYWQEQGYECD